MCCVLYSVSFKRGSIVATDRIYRTIIANTIIYMYVPSDVPYTDSVVVWAWD